VRVSAKAVFSQYSIYPASLNFGAMTSGTRKTWTFTLENKGDLDFKFLICRPEQDPQQQHGPCWGSRGTAVGYQPLLGLSLQTCLTVGMFSVYPGVGSIPPGGQQMITVDCYAKLLGTCKESLSINISNR
ncbi:HYDIN protein, partial [Atlantisia rogersi]|nr:HYDIN protein [Atlantisia rogersi]